jgi:hypothetical protein
VLEFARTEAAAFGALAQMATGLVVGRALDPRSTRRRIAVQVSNNRGRLTRLTPVVDGFTLGPMADAIAGLFEGFNDRLTLLFDRHKELLAQLDYDEARRLGAQGADATVAPLLWAAAVGEKWPTTTVTEFLRMTRQALHKRVVNGTVLGLPGRGTTWFPVWQFDLAAHQVRPVVADIIAAFHDEVGPIDPFVVASWATTDQPELGMSPEEWMAAGKDPGKVVRIAHRAAGELGR